MKKLMIVDLSHLIHRAYYGIKLDPTAEIPTNAIFGTINMLISYIHEVQPTHLIIAKDSPGEKERKSMQDSYKENRKEKPDELKIQMPIIYELLDNLNVVVIESNQYEADDVIASICVQRVSDFDQIIVLTGDKDLMQLVNDKVHIYDSLKKKTFQRKDVFEKFGVYPENIPDLLGLIGDSVDNIEGVKGIGPVTAAKLIEEFSTIENMYENLLNVSSPKVLKILESNKDIALFSKKMAIVKSDIQLADFDCTVALRMNAVSSKKLVELKCFYLLTRLKDFREFYLSSDS